MLLLFFEQCAIVYEEKYEEQGQRRKMSLIIVEAYSEIRAPAVTALRRTLCFFSLTFCQLFNYVFHLMGSALAFFIASV